MCLRAVFQKQVFDVAYRRCLAVAPTEAHSLLYCIELTCTAITAAATEMQMEANMGD